MKLLVIPMILISTVKVLKVIKIILSCSALRWLHNHGNRLKSISKFNFIINLNRHRAGSTDLQFLLWSWLDIFQRIKFIIWKHSLTRNISTKHSSDKLSIYPFNNLHCRGVNDDQGRSNHLLIWFRPSTFSDRRLRSCAQLQDGSTNYIFRLTAGLKRRFH